MNERRARVFPGRVLLAVLLGGLLLWRSGAAGDGEVGVVPIGDPAAPLPITAASATPTEDSVEVPAAATAEETRASLACEQACARAREARSAGTACARRSRLPASYFCPNTDRRFVNPFAILRGEGPGTDLCAHSLLIEASEEASAALARTGSSRVPTSLQALFQAAQNGSSLACASNRVTAPAAEGLRPVVSRITAEEVTSAEARSYCREVQPPPCSQLGGRMTEVAGARVCVAGGLVVDASCLAQSPAKLETLAGAISALRSTGLSCLRGRSGRPGIAPEVGQGFADHLSGTPKTQICCTTGACTAGLPGFQQAGDTVSEHAAADSYGNAEGGTIRVPPAQLSGSTLRGTLFHEMLHQIGLCKSSEHNSFGSVTFTNWAIAKPPGGCPRGYTERVLGRGSARYQAVRRGLGQIIRFDPPPTAVRRDFGRRFPLGASALLRSRSPDLPMTPEDLDTFATLVAGTTPICLKMNACGSGVLPPPPPFIEQWDNVYACEAACYSPRQMAAYTEAERTSVRESCRAPSNRPPGAPLVSHNAGHSSNRCISAPEF